MKIREAVSADAGACSDVARAAKASWGYPDAWLQAWEAELRITPSYVEANTVFVAESNSEVLGVIAAEVGVEGPEISHLWVHPRSHGKGLGRALVARVRQFATSQGWARLRVVSDPFAEAFYARLGAVRVGHVDAPVCGTERQLPVLRLPVMAGE